MHKLLLLFFLATLTFSQTSEKKYFFVFLNSNPEREELPEEKVMELQEVHMSNINRLAEEGKLLIAGPVKGGGGIFVLMAPSIEEVNEYLQTDPAIKANRFTLEAYPMDIAEGKICKVSKENFEMTNYTLIRYEGEFSGRNDLILAQLNFEGRNEGVVIYNYNFENGNEEEIKIHYKAEKIIYTKTLWIAKGSFCE